jgi:glycine reductase
MDLEKEVSRTVLADIKGRKVIALGERDGVSGPAIATCVEAIGAELVFVATECFV